MSSVEGEEGLGTRLSLYCKIDFFPRRNDITVLMEHCRQKKRKLLQINCVRPAICYSEASEWSLFFFCSNVPKGLYVFVDISFTKSKIVLLFANCSARVVLSGVWLTGWYRKA